MHQNSRLFHLERDVDVTGISGTGCVAFGVIFPDNTTVLRWNTEVKSTVIYKSFHEVIQIHGHEGKTRVVFDD